jgi:pimeloyl-ACP methyl ester carboxylesterase
MGKAVAAGTYTDSGWATFHSAKDIKDIIKFVKKKSGLGDQLKRVIITGFSGGGAVTADATLKLKIDGAVPLCAAAAGGLTTWDIAHEVRLVYDYVCDGVANGTFASVSDLGQPNSTNSDSDAIGLALKVDACFGIIGIQPDDGHQAERLAKFLELTQFTGDASHGGDNLNVASALGFAVLGLGDFVWDQKRLNGKRIGFNEGLDYSTLGNDQMLAADYDANVERVTAGSGRKKLRKAFWPDFTKGFGKKVAYPILSMAGANDWLVIPEFNRVYDDALTAGNKAFTQTWIESYGHCVFSEQEVRAIFTKYFEWLGPVGGPYGTQPTATDISTACLALPGGVQGDTCNFDLGFSPGAIYDRVPQREDWPAAAKAPAP